MRIDMPSKLLLDLKNGYNIGKLVCLDYDYKKKDGYLVASPCQEYTINGETYTAIGTVYDHSKLDSVLKKTNPKCEIEQLKDTTLSSAWIEAMSKGQQPSAPEDYIEVEQ